MGFTIKRKYTAFITSLMLFLTVVMFVFTFRQFITMSRATIESGSKIITENFLNEIEDRGSIIASLLAENLINPLYHVDYNAIENLVEGYRSYRNVFEIHVYDPEGLIIHDGTDDVASHGLPMDEPELIRRVFSEHSPIIATHNGTMDIYHPVSLGQDPIGGVRLRMSLAEIYGNLDAMKAQLQNIHQVERNQSYRRLLIASVLIMLAGIALSFMLASRISTPITRMAESARRIGRGDYTNHMEYRAVDEIGDLVNAFNAMQQNLLHSTVSISELEKQVCARTHELEMVNNDLKRYQEELEQTVQARTSELLATNRRLTTEIEERRSIQEKLLRAQKMEIIGTMAAGVAHDLNNILTGMVSLPDLILTTLPEHDPLRNDLMTIKKSGMRAAAVVQDLLNLARKNIVYNETLELRSVINDYLIGTEHQTIVQNNPGIHLCTDFPERDFIVTGSRIHLLKILMNLVSNAAESMPRGGDLLLSLGAKRIAPRADRGGLTEGNYVCLEVADSGDGIEQDNLERIFEPFFTTKIMGRSGSGLGLTVVRETVKDHKGFIDVRSVKGKGTTFTILLPETVAATTRTVLEPSPDSYRGKGESILIVDDLESQRTLLKSIIERLGYRAETSASGEDALAYLKNQPVDLLILDMIMPSGMDGLDTYREVVKIRKEQRAIIVSGYADTSRTERLYELGISTHIRKPYTFKQIGKAVRAELDRLPAAT
jgi:signal transduction histidine kinase/ActR/RegA family two-component response regulator